MTTAEQHLAIRRRRIEADIIVAPDSNTQWGVISLLGGTRGDTPMIVYAGCKTREGAELARLNVINNLDEDGHVYGPSEITAEMWDAFAAGEDAA